MPPASAQDALLRVIVPLAVAAVLAVVDWAAVWVDSPRARRVEGIAKPGVMLALLATAALAPAVTPEARAVRPWLVAGLAASLAGDVLLFAHRFVPGLAAFLVAHLAYLVAFLQLPGEAAWLVAGAAAALVVLATAGRMLVRAAGRAGLRMPVAAYTLAICAMAVAATRTAIPAAAAGAWLFVASDTMLGWGRLRDPRPGLPRGGRGLGTAVMVTYHLGQVLILLALLGPAWAEGVAA